MPNTTLRYAGVCTSCGHPLPAGITAFFDPQTRAVSCSHHHDAPAYRGGVGTISARSYATAVEEQVAARTRATWGPLAPLVALLRGEDQAVRAARKGAAGEERVGAMLDRLAAGSGGRVRVLHDRRIPGRRENIDHLVVAPSGVWAVDAKAYSGRVSTGSLWGAGLRIGRRDGTKLLEQSTRQQRFVRQAFTPLGLPELPTDGALCFVDADMGWWHNGRRVAGVLVATPRVLRRYLRADGPLTPEQVAWAADRLGSWFTPQ